MAEPGVIGTYHLWIRKGNFLCLESCSVVCLASGQILFLSALQKEALSFRSISISPHGNKSHPDPQSTDMSRSIFMTADLNSQKKQTKGKGRMKKNSSSEAMACSEHTQVKTCQAALFFF